MGFLDVVAKSLKTKCFRTKILVRNWIRLVLMGNGRPRPNYWNLNLNDCQSNIPGPTDFRPEVYQTPKMHEVLPVGYWVLIDRTPLSAQRPTKPQDSERKIFVKLLLVFYRLNDDMVEQIPATPFAHKITCNLQMNRNLKFVIAVISHISQWLHSAYGIQRRDVSL